MAKPPTTIGMQLRDLAKLIDSGPADSLELRFIRAFASITGRPEPEVQLIVRGQIESLQEDHKRLKLESAIRDACRGIRQWFTSSAEFEWPDILYVVAAYQPACVYAVLLGQRIDAENEGCTCEERSWYGEEHDSVCPVTIRTEKDRLTYPDLRQFRDHLGIAWKRMNWVGGKLTRREHVGKRYNARKDGTAIVSRMVIKLRDGDDSTNLATEDAVLRYLVARGDYGERLESFLGPEYRYKQLLALIAAEVEIGNGQRV